MWTDFSKSDPIAIQNAWNAMNDFSQIILPNGQRLSPFDTIKMHEDFREKLVVWLEKYHDKKRVIISHHSPVKNPNTKYENQDLLFTLFLRCLRSIYYRCNQKRDFT
jgi:hypothetical protein